MIVMNVNIEILINYVICVALSEFQYIRADCSWHDMNWHGNCMFMFRAKDHFRWEIRMFYWRLIWSY